MQRTDSQKLESNTYAGPDAPPRHSGLVMVCDVDVDLPDATRTHTIEVARGFVSEGFDVDLITRGTDPGLAGIRHHRARGSETGRMLRVTDLNLRSLIVLCAKRRQAERCYVRHKWSNVPIMLTARLLGYRVVTQVDNMPYGQGHEQSIPLAVDKVNRITTLLMCRISHGIVAVTPEIKTQLVDELGTPPERIAALANGADIDFLRPLPRAEAIARAGLDPHCSYVVFCGHFQPWVDFDTLLEAFAKVAVGAPDARLLLVGDGSERERIETQTRRLQIENSVRITGFVRERTAVRDLIAAATVTLSAHRSKYLSPVKLAEYLACGRAIVATELPGLRETIELTGAGIVTPAEPEAMYKAIVSLLDPERADELGANGRRLAEELYSWSSIVHRTVPLFDD
jgi:glycosyltransferase involved in cell wall biosynthesis